VISEKWEQVKEFFEVALEQDPQTRKLFLSHLFHEDPLVAEQVAKLISSYEQAGDFLNEPCALDPDFFEDLEFDQHRFSSGDVLCNRFRIVRLIGKGGMGEVYEAWDEELESHIALKTLRLEVSTHDVFTARFRREIQLARKVTHPNVCRIFDSFKHQLGDGTSISVLSMELLQGQTLAQYLQAKGPLTADEGAMLALQIVEGLNAVHAAGIIHRDLKPSNLILIAHGAKQEVKITDFGIASRISTSKSYPSLTHASKLLGTPDYMAPEQLEHGRATVQSDIYSLGLVLYEMFTGIQPFAGSAIWKRIHLSPLSPKRLVRDLPSRWDKVIRCCLEREPNYRFRSTLEIAKALSADNPLPKLPTKPFSTRIETAAKSTIGIISATVLLAFVFFVVLPRYALHGPGEANGSSVLIIDITTTDDHFSGITVSFKSQLAQSTRLDVQDDDKTKQILKQMKHRTDIPMDDNIAHEVARRSSVSFLITGSLSQRQKGYLLTIKLEHMGTSSSPSASWTGYFIAENDVFEAVHEAARWIRTQAGESPNDIARQTPVEYITTNSWSALRSYNQANKSAAVEDYSAAIFFLQRAIQADHSFAMAHMRLADILISMRHYREGYTEWENTIQSIREREPKQQPLADRENLRIKGQYYEDTGNYKAAKDTFQAFVDKYPTDYLAWYLLGSTLDFMDQKKEAISAFEKAAKLRPDSYGPPEHLAVLHLLLGQFDLAHAEIDKLRNLGGTDWATWLEGHSAFLQGNYDLGVQIMRSLRFSPAIEWQSKSFIYAATFLAEQGKIREAISFLEEGSLFDHSKGNFLGESDNKLALAYLYYHQKQFDKVYLLILQAIALDDNPLRLVEAGTLLSRCGYVSQAKHFLTQLKSVPNIPRIQMGIERLQGEIDLAENQHDSALQHFDRAAQLAWPRESQEYLAHALDQSGKASAEASYKTLVNGHARLWLNADLPLPGIWATSLSRYLHLSHIDTTSSYCSLAKVYLDLQRESDAQFAHDIAYIQNTFNLSCH
jgi:serine/threonine protein kinase